MTYTLCTSIHILHILPVAKFRVFVRSAKFKSGRIHNFGQTTNNFCILKYTKLLVVILNKLNGLVYTLI